ALPTIAEALTLSRAEVHGVITSYPRFRAEPAGRHVLAVCRAESCQAMGGDGLADHARRALGCDFHGTTADGEFTLEPVYCLGLGAQSPAVMLDGQPHARVTPDKLGRLLARAAQGDADARPGTRRSPSTCRATRPRWPWMPTPWRAPSSTQPPGAASQCASCATARAACCGWNRWPKSPRRPAASPTGRCSPTTWPACSRPAGCRAARTACARGRPRTSPT